MPIASYGHWLFISGPTVLFRTTVCANHTFVNVLECVFSYYLKHTLKLAWSAQATTNMVFNIIFFFPKTTRLVPLSRRPPHYANMFQHELGKWFCSRFWKFPLTADKRRMWRRTLDNTDRHGQNLRHVFITNRCFCYVHLQFLVKDLCLSLFTFSLILLFLRLRHISVALMCCRVSFAKTKQSFSILGAAEAHAAAPKRHLSSSIIFSIPERTQTHKHCGSPREQSRNGNRILEVNIHGKSNRLQKFQMKWMLIFPQQLQWRQLYMTVQMLGLTPDMKYSNQTQKIHCCKRKGNIRSLLCSSSSTALSAFQTVQRGSNNGGGPLSPT